MNVYCKHNQISRSQARFLYQGSRISDEDTPESLNMKEHDNIQFYPRQPSVSLCLYVFIYLCVFVSLCLYVYVHEDLFERLN